MYVDSWSDLVDHWQQHPRRKQILRGAQLSIQILTPAEACCLVFSDESVELWAGHQIKPDLVLEGQAAAIDAVLRNQIDITHPVVRGHVQVRNGGLLRALSMSRFLSRLN